MGRGHRRGLRHRLRCQQVSPPERPAPRAAARQLRPRLAAGFGANRPPVLPLARRRLPARRLPPRRGATAAVAERCGARPAARRGRCPHAATDLRRLPRRDPPVVRAPALAAGDRGGSQPVAVLFQRSRRRDPSRLSGVAARRLPRATGAVLRRRPEHGQPLRGRSGVGGAEAPLLPRRLPQRQRGAARDRDPRREDPQRSPSRPHHPRRRVRPPVRQRLWRPGLCPPRPVAGPYGVRRGPARRAARRARLSPGAAGVRVRLRPRDRSEGSNGPPPADRGRPGVARASPRWHCQQGADHSRRGAAAGRPRAEAQRDLPRLVRLPPAAHPWPGRNTACTASDAATGWQRPTTRSPRPSDPGAASSSCESSPATSGTAGSSSAIAAATCSAACSRARANAR